MQQIIDKLSPGQWEAEPITSIMRKLDVTAYVTLPAPQGEPKVPLTDLRAKLTGDGNRLPVVDPASASKFMIHGST